MQQQYRCPNCGTPVAFGVRFCGNCGTQFNWSTQQQDSYGRDVRAQERRGKSPGPILAVIVVCLFLIVGGVIFAFNMISQDTAPSTPPSTAQTPPSSKAPPATFPPSTSVNPSGAGSISPSSGKYEEGTRVTLTATPSSTYEHGDWRDSLGLTRTKHPLFDHWSGAASSSSPTITIIMDSNKEIIAHFAIVPIAPIEITAIELATEYAADEAKANSMYQQRTLQVTGKITYISEKTSLSKTGHLMLDSSDTFGGVMCTFVYSSEWESLKKGQVVTIQGTCTIYHLKTVLIDGCSLVK